MTIEQFEQIKKDAKLMNGNIGTKNCNLLITTLETIIAELQRKSKMPGGIYTEEADYYIDLAKTEQAKDLLDMILTEK